MLPATHPFLSSNIDIKVKFLTADELLPFQEILSGEETVVYNSFKIQKRKKEWLMGRMAAKCLLAERDVFSKPLTHYTISKDKYCRPFCDGSLISISHSNDRAVAAIALNQNCNFLGIDLEYIQDRCNSWYKDYFCSEELINGNNPSDGTRLWTVKEALLKALGLGLTVSLMSVNTACNRISMKDKTLARYRELGSPSISTESKCLDNFWITLVTEGK